MPETTSNIDWTPVTAFYFKVSFQGGVQCDVGFSEVRGLESSVVLNKNRQIEKVTHSDLILKRAMQPLPEKLTKWITESFDLNTFIKTCTVIISLLNENGDAVASWSCSNAYPKKWSLSPLNANKSDLAMETLVLTYDILKREK